MRAFCYASGRIEFGMHLPDGALPIARGRLRDLRALIEPHARRAYDGETLLVPGIPESSSQRVGVKKLEAWLGLIKPHAPKGVRVF